MGARMREEERDAQWLIKNGFLDKCEDVELDGETVKGAVLGYRINRKFVSAFFGRVFQNPHLVFDEDMLKPELQDLKSYVESIKTITVTNQRVAEMYITDGGADMAVPPLKALLHIMAKGEYESMTLESPEFRAMWTRDNIIKSGWYKERLTTFQDKEATRLARGVEYLESFVQGPDRIEGDWKGKQMVEDLKLHDRIADTKKALDKVKSPEYVKFIEGSLGVDPRIYDALTTITSGSCRPCFTKWCRQHCTASVPIDIDAFSFLLGMEDPLFALRLAAQQRQMIEEYARDTWHTVRTVQSDSAL